MDSSKKTIAFVVAIVLSLVTLILGYAMTVSIADSTKSTINNYLSLSTSPEQARILTEQLKNIGTSNVALLETSFPVYSKGDTSGLVPFISALETLAAELHVGHKLTLGSDTSQEGGNLHMAFTVEFRGTVEQLNSYLTRFLALPFFTDVSGISIVDSVNIKGESSVRINGRLYVRSE